MKKIVEPSPIHAAVGAQNAAGHPIPGQLVDFKCGEISGFLGGNHNDGAEEEES